MDANIQLLAQRLDVLEDINNRQSTQIEKLQQEAASLEGAQKQSDRASNSNGKFIGPAISVMVLIASAFLGNFVIAKIDKLNGEVVDLTVAAADREARVRTLSDRKIPSLGEVESALAKVDTRITTLESSYESMRIVDNTQNLDISAIRSNLSSNDAKTAAMEQELRGLSGDLMLMQSTVVSSQKDISAIDAKTSAGFVEVESQLRGLNAMLSVVVDGVNEKIGTLWHKVLGQPLPESKPLPTNIPAQAVTTIGGSATN